MTLLVSLLKRGGLPEEERGPSPPERNLLPARKQERMDKKPATESPRVQGPSEYPNPSNPTSNPPQGKAPPFHPVSLLGGEAAPGPLSGHY